MFQTIKFYWYHLTLTPPLCGGEEGKKKGMNGGREKNEHTAQDFRVLFESR